MAPSGTITLAVIDDNRLVREALTAMLNQLPDVQVVVLGVAGSTFLGDERPPVLLLDVGLRDDDSVRVAAELRQESPDQRIMVMDLMPLNDEVVEFVNAGVSGFILKDSTFDGFIATIRSVAASDKVLPPRMTESRFSQIATHTVKRHVRNVMEKLALHTRLKIAAYSHREGTA